MNTLRAVVFVLAICLVATGVAWAQSQITTGTIQGDVLDEKGFAVPDARVEIRNLDTNLTRSQATGSDGRFSFLQLTPGRYTLTVSKAGFATIVQENVNLTVGQAISLPVSMKISAVEERVVVTATPAVEVTKTESSSTLNQLAISETPVVGRKFEDLLTLTPGVSIVQGPDGDEINFNGQRGVYNNVSLDGGDYNNRFFGEQLGGQRAAIDITLEAVKEFQVVASGASAEFGRTAGGVINVITKSGTNEVHGSLFHFQRLKGLSSSTSDGQPLDGFHREQFGGSIGGPIVKNKMFFFGAAEGITENLTRKNLSVPIGTPCSVAAPVFNSNISDSSIAASADCQRLTLLNFFRTGFNQDEGQPIERPVRNAAVLGKYDWNVTPTQVLAVSYNFDYSKNTNQTFDVPTYGNSANGIEGPSKIQAVNFNLFSTLSSTRLNEGHFTYARESRPRSAAPGTVPDTDMGFGTTFRFGMPFFLEPKVDETLWHTQIRDNFSIVSGKHTIKFGGDWLHTVNTQIFRGFFTGRYIFDSVVGFLHYASPASLGPGFGPTAVGCKDGTFRATASACPGGASGGPLLLYIQHGATSGPTTDATGASSIKNEDFGLFIQDKWQLFPGFTFNYGLRWEAVIFPDPVVPPAQTAYGINLSDPRFPSDGTIHNQKKEFQPRVGFAWDVRKNHKSVLRASWGIYNAEQNMLAQVGAITTNGVQQQEIDAGTAFSPPSGLPTYPGVLVAPVLPPGTFPPGTGITVFSKDYANPRIYHTNVAFEQEIVPNWAVYADFTVAKAVHLTREINPNVAPPVDLTLVDPPGIGATYLGPKPFPNLGTITDTVGSAKSLYRGVTIGTRKRFSQHFQLEANYTYSKDLDDDSNERDPFTFRYANLFNLAAEYSNSDRDERHKFNLFTYAELPAGFHADVRMQAHSAQPISVSPRIVNGVDAGRNTLRKDNAFFTFDWRLQRPFKFGDRLAVIPMVEMFNTFNNKNNVNPLISPGPFNFDGFLRQGVGDPRQAQLAIKFTF